MHDGRLERVEVLHPLGDLAAHSHGLVERELALRLSQDVVEAAALAQLRHNTEIGVRAVT
jgi:hypothetical protein